MTIINIENAQINTVGLEIKSITLNGKQLTLSVFKQIQEEDLITDMEKLNGIPWGYVNYFFGNYKDCTPNGWFHLVWQKGKELRRYILSKDKNRFIRLKEDKFDHRIDKNSLHFLEHPEPKQVYSSCVGHNFTHNIAELNRLINYHTKNYDDYHKKQLEKYIKLKEETLIKLNEIKERYINNEKFILESAKRFDDLIIYFSKLPQLFIAI